jgi:predicted  nucleic acid-binding Zn-ribbon protein
MVSIIDSACGGCYGQLPPQTVIEIKENKQILTCPNCGVLQFWDGSEEY